LINDHLTFFAVIFICFDLTHFLSVNSKL